MVITSFYYGYVRFLKKRANGRTTCFQKTGQKKTDDIFGQRSGNVFYWDSRNAAQGVQPLVGVKRRKE